MKTNTLNNWIKMMFLAGAGIAMVACDKNDNGGNDGGTDPADETAVIGEYAGTMNVLEAAPTADSEEETPSGTEITAKVTADAIQFTDFPVRDLIIKVIGSEEGVDQIMESLGKVDYSIPYTAEINEDKTSVGLTLAPEPLELTLATGTTADGSGDTEGLTIEVEITSEGADCIYDIESKNLTFKLSAAGVKVGGYDLSDFAPFSLEFDLTKKQ